MLKINRAINNAFIQKTAPIFHYSRATQRNELHEIYESNKVKVTLN